MGESIQEKNQQDFFSKFYSSTEAGATMRRMFIFTDLSELLVIYLVLFTVLGFDFCRTVLCKDHAVTK